MNKVYVPDICDLQSWISTTFNEAKKKVAKYFLDAMPSDDHQDLEEIRKEIANVKNYRDLINVLDGYGASLGLSGEFIFDAITSGGVQ